jgi:ferrous iron transport protein B
MAAPPALDEIVIALAGQPNCGKSTIFNAVAGFKVNTANFPGTSVTFTETMVRFEGRAIRLIDLPGTYSISSHDLAEKVARDYLLAGKVDLIINVVDASLLSRSLELTIQLVEMGIPMIVCLNMIDEAERKGIEIDPARFAEVTGLRAVPVVAVQGAGIDELFREALRAAGGEYRPVKPVYDRDVEECIEEIRGRYPAGLRSAVGADDRFVIIRLLEMDEAFERLAGRADEAFVRFVRERRKSLADMHDWPETGVFASHRHALVLDLYEKVAVHRHRRAPGLRERIDHCITNPLGGLAVIAGSLFLMFYASFFLGSIIAGVIDWPFVRVRDAVKALGSGAGAAAVTGLVDGLQAGAGIVLPYLVPLLLLLALYEDIGLLPRIAFMADGLLHRVGLHGKSVIPIVLGYGCNVPALMATRNLENERDRRITMLIIPFMTCAARSVVILALAGKYLGAAWTTAVYALGIGVALAVSFVLSRFGVDATPGIIMDVPPLRRPYFGIILKKIWLRLHEFIAVAWPVIVVSSVLLALFSYLGFDVYVNRALRPFTVHVMNLPEAIGIPLFLGIFRKELILVMLGAALGTADVGAALSPSQLLVLTVFTVLYIPCVATLTTLWKEGGWRLCLFSALLSLGVASAVAAAVARLACLVSGG